MAELSTNIIETLKFLGPGFLAAWVFYGFTAFSKPTQFEQVVQAFIFTLIVQSLIELEKVSFQSFNDVLPIVEPLNGLGFLIPTVNAVLLGLMFSFFANRDYFHSFIRKIGLSRETSFPSEWFGVFSEQKCYVVLHLKDERRLLGWPAEWPSDPSSGHFNLEDISWLINEGEVKLETVDSILIKSEDVKWVEFIKSPKE